MFLNWTLRALASMSSDIWSSYLYKLLRYVYPIISLLLTWKSLCFYFFINFYYQLYMLVRETVNKSVYFRNKSLISFDQEGILELNEKFQLNIFTRGVPGCPDWAEVKKFEITTLSLGCLIQRHKDSNHHVSNFFLLATTSISDLFSINCKNKIKTNFS